MNELRERIEALVRELPQIDAEGIALALVDEDVANGAYDGCSPELELQFMEYRGIVDGVVERLLV